MLNRISKTFQNGQYQYLAEYALAASAFFIGRKNENAMFEKLKVKLSDEYRAYADKGKLCAKQDNLKSAVKCEVEQELSAPQLMQEETQTEEPSEVLHMEYG